MATAITAIAASTRIVFGRQDGNWPESLWVLVPLAALFLLGAGAWYWLRRPSRPWRGRWAAAVLAIVCGLLLLIAGCPAGPLAFESWSICTVCGAVKSESNPTLLPFVAYEHEGPTELSAFAESTGLVADQVHAWAFGVGGGMGIRASGPAMTLGGVRSDRPLREFLAATIKWRGAAEAREWLRIILTPREENDLLDPWKAVQPDWDAQLTNDQAEYERSRQRALNELESMCPRIPLPAGADDSPPGSKPAD